MTKARARERHHNIVVAAKRLRRRKRQVVVRRLKYKHLAMIQGLLDPRTGLVPIRLHAPRVFTLSEEGWCDELLRFIHRIKSTVQKGHPVFIDFARTEKMISDGTLLFYAELTALKSVIHENRLIKCNYPRDNIVEQVLQHIGVFNILEKRPRSAIDHETVKHWHIASGVKAEGAAFNKVYEGTIVPALTAQKLYAGVTEAMTNCCQHAYPDKTSEERRWWMFSQEVNDTLMVAFCDLGIGIPASLRTSGKWSQVIDNVFSSLGVIDRSDAEYIRAAFQLGKTRTKQSHRGKGLQEIKDALGRKQGRLWVHSGQGRYRYEPAAGVEEASSYHIPIPGTMIYWSIPAKGKDSGGKQPNN